MGVIENLNELEGGADFIKNLELFAIDKEALIASWQLAYEKLILLINTIQNLPPAEKNKPELFLRAHALFFIPFLSVNAIDTQNDSHSLTRAITTTLNQYETSDEPELLYSHFITQKVIEAALFGPLRHDKLITEICITNSDQISPVTALRLLLTRMEFLDPRESQARLSLVPHKPLIEIGWPHLVINSHESVEQMHRDLEQIRHNRPEWAGESHVIASSWLIDPIRKKHTAERFGFTAQAGAEIYYFDANDYLQGKKWEETYWTDLDEKVITLPKLLTDSVLAISLSTANMRRFLLKNEVPRIGVAKFTPENFWK